MQVLNPSLYEALRQLGRVKVSHPGEPMSAVYVPGDGNKAHLSLSSYGESYVVCCPYCHDTSGHLYVNHRWGQFDAKTRTRNLWLAKCFRDDCLKTWENQKDLADRVLRNRGQAAVSPIPVAAPEPLRLHRVDLPPDFRLLTELWLNHPACEYVKSRGFDRGELVELWEVGYSTTGFFDYQGRLVFPLWGFLPRGDDEAADIAAAKLGGGDLRLAPWEIVGYQGRVIGEVAKKQRKYLFSDGTHKSLVLYGLDQMPPAKSGPIIVCEGPTDVWRAGPGAVALLGKSISDAQCKLIRSEHPGRDVVVMLDPEASKEALKVADRLRGVLSRDLISGIKPGRVVVAELPDDRDPGDCTREEIWGAAMRAIKPQKKSRRQSQKK